MADDSFTQLFEEAMEEGQSITNGRRNKILVGMYRNYDFNSHFDYLVDEILLNESDWIRRHYWDDLVYAIQCSLTTSRLIELLGVPSFQKHNQAIISALITKKFNGSDEENLYNILKKIPTSIEADLDRFILLCSLLKRETEFNFRELLLPNIDVANSHYNNRSFFEALAYQLHFEDIDKLPTLMTTEHSVRLMRSYHSIEYSNLARVGCILSERFKTRGSLRNINKWLTDPDLYKFGCVIISKIGSSCDVNLLENAYDTEIHDNYFFEIAKSFLAERLPIPTQLEIVEDERILLKGGLWGWNKSLTGYFGYYTGLEQKQYMSTETRHEILSKVYLSELVFPESLVPIRTQFNYGASFDRRKNDLIAILKNLEARQNFAAKNARTKPWHPQGLYTYGILTEDACWLAETYGRELGVYVCRLPTNVSGINAFKILTLNNNCSECGKSRLFYNNGALKCLDCGRKVCDEVATVVEIRGVEREKFTLQRGADGTFSFNDYELTEKDIRSISSAHRIIIDSELPKLSDHMGPMIADIEESQGISGDAYKRHGL